MQTARHFVAVAAEFAAGVQQGQNNLYGGFAAFVHIDGNTAPVVNDGNAVVFSYNHFNICAITRQSLVNGIIDDFVN